jgi:Ca2+-binding RTX toxin-like protein
MTYRISPQISADMWNLDDPTAAGARTAPAENGIADINIWHAWQKYSGQGVSVGIYDTGVDYAHVDLARNVDTSRHVVIDGTERSGNRTSGDWNAAHGTLVAGVIAGLDNGVGPTGIAYEASITAVDNGLLDWAGDMEALAQAWRYDVTNHSYSYAPFSDSLIDGPLSAALDTAARLGRGGLGTIMVKSAGNDRTKAGEETQLNGLQVDRHTIDVGAVDLNGKMPAYSNPGATLLVVTPSSGNTGEPKLMSTDLSGDAGREPGDYVFHDTADGFGQTSAATPQVTGTVALMLEANPNLGWRDVQDILAISARETGGAALQGHEQFVWKSNGSREWNGGGYHFSNDYGFGLLDASAAVRLAESWTQQQTSANEVIVSTGFQNAGTWIIPDADAFGDYDIPNTWVRQFTMDASISLDHIEIRFDHIKHDSLRDVVITLTSPSGMSSVLLGRPGLNPNSVTGDTDVDNFEIDKGWVFGSNAFRGETSAGLWTLSVSDMEHTDEGTFTNPHIIGYGSALSADNTYFYTDEFATFWTEERATLSDSNGGIDTLNGAALSGPATIDLTVGATSYIANRNLTIHGRGTVIENAVGGAGHDVIRGNAANNWLRGGDGNDQLDGRTGQDTLEGGEGNDTFAIDATALSGSFGGSPFTIPVWDMIVEKANEGVDTARVTVGGGLAAPVTEYLLHQNVENAVLVAPAGGYGYGFTLKGNALDNALTGGTGIDRIEGGDGNDTLNGAAGLDTLVGGEGDDTYHLSDVNFVSYDLEDSFGMEYDQVVEAANGGVDTMVVTPLSYHTSFGLAANVENLTVLGSVNATLYGDGVANRLTGNDGFNVVHGGGGDDTLNGGAAFDRLFGGTGDDTYELNGVYWQYIGAEDQAFIPLLDEIVEQADEGVDSVVLAGFEGAFTSFTLDVNLENLRVLGTYAFDLTGNDAGNRLTGNDGFNVIRGGAGDDVLDGGAAFDRLIGGTGDDTYELNGVYWQYIGAEDQAFIPLLDAIVEQADEGVDSVVLAGLEGEFTSFTLADHLENLRVLGTDAFDLTGNAVANVIDGNDGRNRIDGAAGADRMYGHGGSDHYLVDDADDLVIEFQDEGLDLVAATVSYTLAAVSSVEGLYAADKASTDAIDLTGNELANTIEGNAGANRLDGGAGADSLAGFGGDDTYVVDHAGDTVIERFGEGYDTVLTSVDFEVGWRADVERVVAVGDDDLSLTGNGFEQVLVGNAGRNVLRGGGAADTLDGGAGNDHLYGGEGEDTFLFSTPGEGVDTVFDFAPGDKIALKASAFGLAGGSLADAGVTFSFGSGATGAGPALFFDTATDRLFFDADGSGAGAAVELATFLAQPGKPGAIGNLGGVAATFEIQATGDFDRNGISDVLWRDRANNAVGAWMMDAKGGRSWADIGTVNVAYNVVASGDFDGDGVTDVLWRNDANGHTGAWLMRDGQPRGWLDLGNVDTAWTVKGVGDFDANGIDDILWSNQTTQKAGGWLMGAGSPRDWLELGNLNGWEAKGVGDFNADGVDDVLFFNEATRQVGAWRINSNGQPGGWWALPTLEAGMTIGEVADLNGDGTADIHLHDAASGVAKAWSMRNGAVAGALDQPGFDADWQLAGSGQLDGTGATDLIWHNTTTGAVTLNAAIPVPEQNGMGLTNASFLFVA